LFDFFYQTPHALIISLQAEAYRETGSFARMNDMNNLIETAIWNKAAAQDRRFLMSVSLLGASTSRQATPLDSCQEASKIDPL
jgi:hypothetical protein